MRLKQYGQPLHHLLFHKGFMFETSALLSIYIYDGNLTLSTCLIPNFSVTLVIVVSHPTLDFGLQALGFHGNDRFR